MRRFLALLCALVMLFSLSACSAEVDADAETKEKQSDEGKDEKDPTQKDSEDKEETEETEDATEGTEAVEEVEFEEIVVVDNEYCTIKITGIDPDNLWGYTLNAYFENKSSDKTYMYAVDAASINGVEADPFFATEVPAGKKSNEEISFDTNTLKANGMGDVTDIAISFRVYDINDWTADPVAEPTVHIYPCGEGNAVAFSRVAQPGDTVLVDNEYVTVIVTGYEENERWGYTANLFIENKTDTSIMVSADEASVNGYMADPYYADSVGAGNCAFSSMSWATDTFEENGIDEVETIEFVLRVYDNNDWMADDFVNEIVTLNP